MASKIEFKRYRDISWINWKGGFIVGFGYFWKSKSGKPFNDLVIGLGLWELRIKFKRKQDYPQNTHTSP